MTGEVGPSPPKKSREVSAWEEETRLGKKMVAWGSIRSRDLSNSPAETHGDGKNLKGSWLRGQFMRLCPGAPRVNLARKR